MEIKLPYSEEAERSVLGSLMYEADTIDEVVGLLNSNDFYSRDHQKIYQTIVDLYKLEQPFDTISVIAKLKDRNDINKEGQQYILQLADSVATTANVRQHAEIIAERSIRRKAVEKAKKIIEIATMSDRDDIQDLIDDIEREALSIRPERKSGLVRITDGLGEIIHNSMNGTEETMIKTGFKQLDEFLGGLQRQSLIVLSARPSQGKTAISLQIAENVSKQEHGPVAVFSQEMAREQLQRRMLAKKAQVSGKKLLKKNVDDREFNRLVNTIKDFDGMNLYIDDTPNVSVEYVQSELKRLKREHGEIGLVVIDYLGLMKHSERRNGTKEEAVAETSRRLKTIARQLNCPVWLLVQMNRSVESRSVKDPQMSDLRDSGQIEADADIIAFLSHDEERSFIDENRKVVRFIELDIVKGRDVGVGKFGFNFRPDIQLFTEEGKKC